jgi:cephalosporin-C deacetylase-like acetyl esterase
MKKLLLYILCLNLAGLISHVALPQSRTPVLPGTKLLDWQGDIASRLIDSCDAFLLREIERSIDRRTSFWNRDVTSSDAYKKSVESNRDRLAHIIGLRDQRISYQNPEMLGIVAEGPSYRVHNVRWPAFGQVHGEGLLVLPVQEIGNRAAVVIPDADQTPEEILGLTGDLAPKLQTARLYAEKGYRVLIPTLINRKFNQHNLSNREFLYRPAFELGRHLIGYEIQKILAGVDGLLQSGSSEITVAGWGEGGLLALYAGAVDTRIDETHVGGYFGSRQEVWREPAYRNVFGLLEQFGDAEIASLITPRKLVIHPDMSGPEVIVSPGTNGKPGRLTAPSEAEIDGEIDRLKQITDGLGWNPIVENAEIPPGNELVVKHLPDAQWRHSRLMTEIDLHNQLLLRESPYVRKKFMANLNTDSLSAFEQSVEFYRNFFAKEVIGQFDYPLLAPNAKARKLEMESDQVSAYEVVLDVFPGLFAYGILILPNDLKPGEQRPVVVCQHGLEGRPQSTIGQEGYSSYKAFATRLAERGYITFAPQNIYIFKDRFRTLQFKANAIKKTLFSIMVPQHQQLVNWLGGLDFVDEKRIAFYGLSYGGKSAMRIPPLVKNYCLSICSADFNEWVWKNASTRSPFSYATKGEYEIFEWDLGSTFNYAEMAALIAPRPFMVERGHFDGVAPDETVAYEYAKVRHLYQARLNIGDRTEIEWFAGPHTINGEGTFRFLDKHLKFQPSNIPSIRASTMEAPPDWAQMQRRLIHAMEQAGDFYWDRFTHEGGSTISEGPYDDLYEMFYNWPDFYMIGANKRFFDRALSAYNGITRTNTPHPPDSGDYFHRLYKEFPTHDDFFHISEGMTLFYNLALGDPNIPENMARARRFAGFYLNEDPEAQNFDPKHKLVRSIFTGSKGPLTSSDATYNLRYGHASLFPVVEQLEPNWHENPDRKLEIQQLYDSVVTRTDVPVNLGITGLMTHAFLTTGDEKYKLWVLDYVDGWMEKVEENGGILPDNIGKTGKIGEHRNGQWWGGLYGWYGRYGVMMMFASLSVASECAYLLTGDVKYLELLRGQLDQMLDRARFEPDGQMLVPYRRNHLGWHSYRPMMIRDLVHLWHASMDSTDWRRIERVQRGHRYKPLANEGIWGKNTLDHLDTATYERGESFDWSKELVQGDRTMGKSEYARWMYYAGKNQDWPLEALKADFQEMTRRIEFMRRDPRPIAEIQGDDTYPNNPVIIKALQQTTMGTPQTIYFGGLLRATVRYFDARNKRPGLPEDVAALVDGLEASHASIHLVNLNPVETRKLIVQAGAFGEHQFTEVAYVKDDAWTLVSVQGKYMEIILPPSTSIRLKVGMDRYVNVPSYAFPWNN